MYGLNVATDFSFLKGRELVQISVGIHQVTFGFDADVCIAVESGFRYFSKIEHSEWQPGRPDAAAPTMRLLGRTVDQVQGHTDGTLEIGFSNADRLTVLDSNKEYESYQISAPGKIIVV